MSLSTAAARRIKAVVIGLGLGLAVLTSDNWWKILTDHVPDCGKPNCVADFVTFYAQGALIWEDRQALYDLDKQLAYQKKLAPVEQVLPFVYPPITALLMAPLTLLPFSAAFLALTVMNILLLVSSLKLLIRELSLTPDQAQWLSLFALCNFGVHAVVFYGQTAALVLYFLTRHIISQKRSQPFNAGTWAGLLCVKPQFLPIPHLVFLLGKNWRGLIVGALTSISLTIGAFLFIGPETSKQYFLLAQRMVTADNDWWNQWRAMHNWRALTIYWLPGNVQPYVWWVGCIAVVAAVIFVNLRSGGNRHDFATRWIVNLLALLVIIPHLFTHDLTLLIVPAALLLSLDKPTVPIPLGIGLVAVGLLPAVNYLAPTIMATTLVILFLLSLRLTKTAQS